MPYFVKSHGPGVLKRGPFVTEGAANEKSDELKLDPLYACQDIYVEYAAHVEPERHRSSLDPRRRKYRAGPVRFSRRRALVIWFEHGRETAQKETH